MLPPRRVVTPADVAPSSPVTSSPVTSSSPVARPSPPARSRPAAAAVPALLVLLALGAAACGSAGGTPGAGVLRVSGSTTVNPVAADAAEVLRGEGLRVTVDTQGGSAGGLAQLGAGEIDVAMSSKPISHQDRRRFPEVDFVATAIGEDAVGIVVRREVADGGVRSLDRRQLRALFEGRVGNWKEVGGPDLEVVVYDKEPGRGTREVLEKYLYGESAPPPPATAGNVAVIGGNEEGRAKAVSTPGAVTPLSVAFAAGESKLAAVAVDGVHPTAERIREGAYPLSRPLFLVTDGPPAGAAERFVDFVLSPPGQQLVRKHGYLTLADLRGR